MASKRTVNDDTEWSLWIRSTSPCQDNMSIMGGRGLCGVVLLASELRLLLMLMLFELVDERGWCVCVHGILRCCICAMFIECQHLILCLCMWECLCVCEYICSVCRVVCMFTPLRLYVKQPVNIAFTVWKCESGIFTMKFHLYGRFYGFIHVRLMLISMKHTESACVMCIVSQRHTKWTEKSVQTSRTERNRYGERLRAESKWKVCNAYFKTVDEEEFHWFRFSL